MGVHGGARGLTLTHTCVPLSSYAQYHTWMSGPRYAHRSLSRRFGRRRAGHIWAAGLEYACGDGSKGVGYRLDEVVAVGGGGCVVSGSDVRMAGRWSSAVPRFIKWRYLNQGMISLFVEFISLFLSISCFLFPDSISIPLHISSLSHLLIPSSLFLFSSHLLHLIRYYHTRQ